MLAAGSCQILSNQQVGSEYRMVLRWKWGEMVRNRVEAALERPTTKGKQAKSAFSGEGEPVTMPKGGK
jgi:hypothetical protein